MRNAILSLRDTLKDIYGRVGEPKTIAYHLLKAYLLKSRGVYLPQSPRSIWRVLKDGGRIPHPVHRPSPIHHWEMDFGQLGKRFEFLSVMDRGTSIMVNTQWLPIQRGKCTSGGGRFVDYQWLAAETPV